MGKQKVSYHQIKGKINICFYLSSNNKDQKKKKNPKTLCMCFKTWFLKICQGSVWSQDQIDVLICWNHGLMLSYIIAFENISCFENKSKQQLYGTPIY